MEAETPCVEYVYQRLVQLVARAFYKLEMKALFIEDEPPDTAPPPKSRASKKQPVRNLKQTDLYSSCLKLAAQRHQEASCFGHLAVAFRHRLILNAPIN